MYKKVKIPTWLERVAARIRAIDVPFHSGVPLYRLVRFVYVRGLRNSTSQRAAALTFYFMMALPSFLLCVFSVSPFIPFFARAFNREVIYLVDVFSPDENTYKNLSIILQDLVRIPNRSALSLSIVLTFYFASNVVMVIIKAFERSLDVKLKFSVIKKRARSFLITLRLLFIIWIGISLLIALKAFMNYLFEQWNLQERELSSVYKLLQTLLFILLTLISTGMLYKYVSVGLARVRVLSAGAFFVTAVYGSLIYLFSFWVNHYVSYNRIFGSLGTLVVVLFLMYCFSYIFLLGFEINLGIHAIIKQKQEKDKQ